MALRPRLAALLCLGLLIAAPAQAEVDSTVFYDVTRTRAAPDGRLSLVLEFLGFLEDNEYRNELVDGDTWGGTRLTPRLALDLAAHTRLSAGLSFTYVHGDGGPPRLGAFVRFKTGVGPLALVFGTLEGQLTHRLIDPLLDHARVILRPHETGLQLKWDDGARFADLWVDWVTMQRPGDDFQEEVQGGLSSWVEVLAVDSVVGQLSLQLVGRHLGGSLGVRPLPVQTLFDGAAGGALSWSASGALQRLWVSGWLLGYVDNSMSFQPAYPRGWGAYGNLGATFRYLGSLELALWHGEGFINPMGAPLYSSVSRRQTPGLRTQDLRDVVFLRLARDLFLGEAVFVSLRAELHHDLSNRQPGFSTGVYVGWRGAFVLTRVAAVTGE